MWSICLVFCDCGFHSVCPLMDKDKRLMEAFWWETWGGNWVFFWMGRECSVNLWSNFLLKGGAMFPPCCLTWDQTMVEVMKIMATSFKSALTAASVPPVAGHHRPMPETPGHSWTSLGQSLVGSLLLFPVSWCTEGFVCALQDSVSPIIYKFWCLFGGVNGNLLQSVQW